MELQELKQLWSQYDHKLGSDIQVNKNLLKEVSITKINSLLKEFKMESIFELVVDILCIVFLVNILIRNYYITSIAISAIILIIIGVMSIFWNSYKLKEIKKINFSATVIETQKRLTKLKYQSDLEIKSLYILIPFFWFFLLPFLINSFLGFDLINIFSMWWLYQLAGSVIVAIIIVWFIKRFPDKKMQAAIDFLEDIKDYENPK